MIILFCQENSYLETNTSRRVRSRLLDLILRKNRVCSFIQSGINQKKNWFFQLKLLF